MRTPAAMYNSIKNNLRYAYRYKRRKLIMLIRLFSARHSIILMIHQLTYKENTVPKWQVLPEKIT